ncbi:MAG: MerR family transcriptional regulator [Thermodesulfobacteriota bacterium]
MTIEDLIKKAKRRKIDLGTDPEKTIRICIRLGLISKPKRKKTKVKGVNKTVSVFPESTLEKLEHIKALKSEGLSLEEIRESFALEYVQTALRDLLSKADDEKVGQLAHILGSKDRELESIVQAPLIYLIEGMSPDEAKKLLTLFFGVGFYALLEAEQALEELRFNDSRRALSKAIFYNSVAVLRIARTTGDTKLEATASGVYEKVVLEPIRKASERVRKEFKKSIDVYLQEKGL